MSNLSVNIEKILSKIVLLLKGLRGKILIWLYPSWGKSEFLGVVNDSPYHESIFNE